MTADSEGIFYSVNRMLNETAPEVMPIVSVITPLYNSAPYIETTLKSLCAQTYPHWQSMLVNDGSQDNTAELIKPFLSDRRFTYTEQQNQGIAGARNTGIRQATGEWICLLDHDDRWHPEKLHRQLTFAALHHADIVCSDAMILEGGAERLYSDLQRDTYGDDTVDQLIRSSSDRTVDLFQLLIQDDFLPASTVMIRRSLFEQHGLLDIDAAPADDYDMWLRCMPAAKIAYLYEPLLEYVLHGNNYSRHVTVMREKTIYVLLKAWARFTGDTVRSAQFRRSLSRQYRDLLGNLVRRRQVAAVIRHLVSLLLKGQGGLQVLAGAIRRRNA